ncbi:hypothetical protein F4802DRAFT_217042 [Xylaria palmicola]|nr:hypothetical protein F4802DRAFT_217042 [Xylaria palmicola]
MKEESNSGPGNGTLTAFTFGRIPAKGPIQAPPKPTDCTPAEASLCLTTTSFGTTVTGDETRTTSSQVKSRCETITGCNFRDVEATKTVDTCTLQKRTLELTEWLEPTADPRGALPLVRRTTHQVRAEPDWSNCGESPGPDGILWPYSRGAGTQQATRAILERRKLALGHDFIEFRADDLDFTAFYYVYNMGPVALAYFNSAEVPSVLLAYYPSNPFLPPGVSFKRDVSNESSFNETYVFDEPSFQETSRFETWNAPLRMSNHEKPSSVPKHSGIDKTFDAPGVNIRGNVEIRDVAGNATEPGHHLGKRTVRNWFNAAWHLSMLTWPPAIPFNVARDVLDHGPEPHDFDHDPPRDKYTITADDSWGRGQTVYIMDSGWDSTAAEYAARAAELPFKTYGKMPDQSSEKPHGSRTTAFAAGNALGMAKNARVRFAQVPTKTRNDKTPSINQGEIVERFLEALINIANDAATQPKDTCVVNMSWGIPPRRPVQRLYWSIFRKFISSITFPIV